jgi:hypothetical protein
VVVLPALAAIISLACAGLLGRDAKRRTTPDKIAWLIAFTLFSLAAAAEVAGSLIGWSPLLVRGYYLAGAMLVVGFLGLGQLYLLAPDRIARIGPGLALFVTAVAVALLLETPVDSTRLATAGWHALERGPILVAVTVTLNVLGTALVVGGAIYSAWQFWRRGIFRHRMIGCLLIAGGTLVVASGGTLTRLGRPEYLYLAMAVGVSIIFAGYLETRRRETPVVRRPAVAGAQAAGNGALAPTARNGHAGGDEDPAVAYLATLLSSGSAQSIAERCAFWSIEPEPVTRFDRAQARRVWSLRLRLPVAAQAALDELSAPTQIQLADLYFEVLLPGVEASRAERSQVLRPKPN